MVRKILVGFGVALSVGLLQTSAQAQSNGVSGTPAPTAFSFPKTSPICSQGKDSAKGCVTLSENSHAKKVDVFLLIDDTGSFGILKKSVREAFGDIMVDIGNHLPGVEFGFGVGRFEDFGGPGRKFTAYVKSSTEASNAPDSYSEEILYDSARARPFVLNQPIITAAMTGSHITQAVRIVNAMLRTAPGTGGDEPESTIEALYQIATGAGFDGNGDGKTNGLDGSQKAGTTAAQTGQDTSGDVPAFSSLDGSVQSAGAVGGAGFRSDALKIVIVATDVCPVTPFDRNSGIPSQIHGIGSVESVNEFKCSPQFARSRFGYVSKSKTIPGEGDVAPAGAHTLPETVAALNANGIRVMGIVPGLVGDYAGVPKGTGPQQDARAWLSAMARLTGAVDSSGKPLVVYHENGGEALKQSIINAVVAAATQPFNVSVRISDATGSNLSLASSKPTVATGIQPGQKACFDLSIRGSGNFLAASANVDFFDALSGLSFAKAPLAVTCAQTPPTMPEPPACSGIDISKAKLDLDNSSLELRNLVIKATQKLARNKKTKKAARKIRARADALYKANWMAVNRLPGSVLNCPAQLGCSTVSFQGTLAEYRANSNELLKLVQQGVKRSKKIGLKARNAKKQVKAAQEINQVSLTLSGFVPTSGSVCFGK